MDNNQNNNQNNQNDNYESENSQLNNNQRPDVDYVKYEGDTEIPHYETETEDKPGEQRNLSYEGYAEEKHSEEQKVKSKRRWGTPIMAAVIGGAVALGSGSYLGFVDFSSLQGSDTTASAINSSVAEKDGLKLQSSTASNTDMVKMIKDVSPAVVGVVNIQKQSNYYEQGTPTSSRGDSGEAEKGTGSGVVFKKSGKDAFIVTNNHVIEGANAVEVSTTDGKRVTAKLVGTDPLTDLAVLRVDSSAVTKVAEFADSGNLNIGENVLAIGNPLGLDFAGSVTQGIISGLQRSVTVSTSAGDWDMDVIQTDAAINPGNSGGALINAKGQVIGINSMKISSEGVEGIGFAIPSNDVADIVNDLLADGKVQRPYVGVGLQSVSEIPQYILNQQLNLPNDVTEGVIVTQVETGSAAAQAGLQEKDVIVAINNQNVASIGEFRKYLYTQTKSGDKIKLTVYRNGQKKSVSVTVKDK